MHRWIVNCWIVYRELAQPSLNFQGIIHVENILQSYLAPAVLLKKKVLYRFFVGNLEQSWKVTFFKRTYLMVVFFQKTLKRLMNSYILRQYFSVQKESFKCSSKYVFLKNSQMSHENTCVGVPEGLQLKRLQHRCFSTKFAKFLGTSVCSFHVFIVLRVKVYE